MTVIASGVYQAGDDGDLNVEKLQDITRGLIDGERKRLTEANPQYPWWADIVFFLRDMNGITNLILLRDDEASRSISEGIATLVSSIIQNLVLMWCDGDRDKAITMLGKLVQDSEEIELVMQRAVERELGTNVEH